MGGGANMPHDINKLLKVLEASVNFVCSTAFRGICDEEVMLEKTLLDLGFIEANKNHTKYLPKEGGLNG